MEKLFRNLITILIIPLFFLASCNKIDPSNNTTTPPISDSTSTLKEFDNVYMDDLTVTYDGNIYSLMVKGDFPSNAKILYQNNDQSDACIYTVKATISCEGYKTKTLSANLTIEKAEYVVGELQFLDKTVVYDGNEHSIEVIGNLPNEIKIEYENNKLINAGQVTAKAHLKSTNPNYKDLPTLDATLTVLKSKIEITKENFPDGSFHYDGTEKHLILDMKVPEAIKVTFYNNSLTEPGEVEATVKFELIDTLNYEPLEINEITFILTVNVPDGLTFEKNDDGTLMIKEYSRSSIAHLLIVPRSVNGVKITKIASNAFFDCYALFEIKLPDTLEYIDDYAFQDCYNLVEVSLPSSITYMGEGVFSGCDVLEYVYLEQGINTSKWNNNWNSGMYAQIIEKDNKK